MSEYQKAYRINVMLKISHIIKFNRFEWRNSRKLNQLANVCGVQVGALFDLT